MILPRPLHFLPPFQSYLYLLSSSPDEEKKMKNPPDGDHASGGRVNAIKSPPQAALTFGQFRIFWGRYRTNICEASEILGLQDWVFFYHRRSSEQVINQGISYLGTLTCHGFQIGWRGDIPKIYFFDISAIQGRGGMLQPKAVKKIQKIMCFGTKTPCFSHSEEYFQRKV